MNELEKLGYYYKVLLPEDILIDNQENNLVKIYKLTDVDKDPAGRDKINFELQPVEMSYAGPELKESILNRLEGDQNLDLDLEKNSVFNLGLIAV